MRWLMRPPVGGSSRLDGVVTAWDGSLRQAAEGSPPSSAEGTLSGLPYDGEMADIINRDIEAYAEAHTTQPPAHLERLATEVCSTLESPGMMVGRLEGRFLEMLVFASGATSILEIGTYGGYSSLSMAAGLAPGGLIVTCEINPMHAEFAQRHIAASPFASSIEVLVGPALVTIDTLPGPFDLVFIDADKGSYVGYYEAVLPKLAPRGLIVADNTLWRGKVLDESDTSVDTLALRAFNDLVSTDSRVVAVQTTVRDGVTLIRRATA